MKYSVRQRNEKNACVLTPNADTAAGAVRQGEDRVVGARRGASDGAAASQVLNAEALLLANNRRDLALPISRRVVRLHRLSDCGLYMMINSIILVEYSIIQ